MSPPEDTWMVNGEVSRFPWGPSLLSFYYLTVSQDIELRCLVRLICLCEYLLASIHCSCSAMIDVLKICKSIATSWGVVWNIKGDMIVEQSLHVWVQDAALQPLPTLCIPVVPKCAPCLLTTSSTSLSSTRWGPYQWCLPLFLVPSI